MAHVDMQRRRAPRVRPRDESQVVFQVSMSAQVLDISPSGVLLASKSEPGVGDHAELRLTIGARPVSVPIEIRRVSLETNPMKGGARYLAAAIFLPMDAEQGMFLEQLLSMERV
jgi:hypothetical protein